MPEAGASGPLGAGSCGASAGSRPHSGRGPRDFVAFLDAQSGAPVHPDVIGFEREDQRMAGTVEAALRWCDSPGERVRSFANSRPTREDGAHVAGLRDGVAAAVNAYVRERQLLTAADPDLAADRIGEGLTAVVSVKLDRPEFLGATHGVLGGAAVRGCVAEAVREHLSRWFEEQPERAEAAVGRILQGAPPGLSSSRPLPPVPRSRAAARPCTTSSGRSAARHVGHADLLREAIDGAVGE
ncbi:DUF664 domain-containing protein [Streptomyces aurantiogriseus]|uniref:DUF664 domain-containing protein n=1 Tax=Streptomyces aurantiogriseus TaxID=66870 RepID=UPI001E4760DB|nr:DUF664 domain-containing protein [Streptomyces aurantiogriseus]